MGLISKKTFEREIPKLYPRLHRSMTAYLSGTGLEAEDIMQETFLKAYKNIDQFDGKSSFYTWLYAIARNLSIDEFRKRKTEKMRSPIPVDDLEVESDQFKSEEEKNRTLALRKAIAELPELLKSVVVLKTLDGLSYKEISKVTGVNEQTLKNRMFRAKKELADTLMKMDLEQ